MKALISVILCCGILNLVQAQDWLTRPEKTQFKETSLYDDVIRFIQKAEIKSELIRISSLGRSSEGRMIPLVIISKEKIASPYQLKMTSKPVVLIMANIHAGEVEGKEACQMLIRDIAEGRFTDFLENQILLVIPIFNPDGNEKLGKNRHDKGPELAGTRANGQNLDLNRDYIKMESPEIKALIRLFNTWDPVLIVDMHTTNGSYHRHPVTYSTLMHPNSPKKLQDYMWQKLFPAVNKTLKVKYGYESIPYGNFADRFDLEKGWAADAVEPRYGSNYAGLRNRFTILDENYSYADFKTRVLASFGFIKSILEFTTGNVQEMERLAAEADRETVQSFSKEKLMISYKLEKLFDVTIKSFEHIKEKVKEEDRAKYPPWVGEYVLRRTDKEKDYTIPYLSRAVPEREIDLPLGYIIPEKLKEIVDNLIAHGIIVERLESPFTADQAQVFQIEKIELSKTIYQGHVQNILKGSYSERSMVFSPGSWYVSLQQPLARLIPVILEPESPDSLASWGYFNRHIVQQWSRSPSEYPVCRVMKRPTVPMIVE